MKPLSAWFCFFYSMFIIYSSAQRTYGAFKLTVLNLQMCKGPKRFDCCDIKAKMNGTVFVYDIDIKKNVIPNRGKVTATMNGQELLRLHMKKPCDHLFMKPLFQSILNATQKCEFKKGRYLVSLDIEEVANKYYQGMFLFGNLTFKSLFYNDECNFSCVTMDVLFSPKNNSTKN